MLICGAKMNSRKNWKFRFENFEKAFEFFAKARDRIRENLNDDLLRAGFIQAYEFTLELSWKTLADFFQEQGFIDISGPKKVLRTAFQEGYVINGAAWIKALDERNLTTHTYNEDLAKQVATDIIEIYYPLIRDLYVTLKKEVNNE